MESFSDANFRPDLSFPRGTLNQLLLSANAPNGEAQRGAVQLPKRHIAQQEIPTNWHCRPHGFHCAS